jgi:hypothetical protein
MVWPGHLPGRRRTLTIYRFEEFELDTTVFELRHSGRVVHMEPQVFSVLAHLVEHRDRVVSKIELLDEVWLDRFVSESALTGLRRLSVLLVVRQRCDLRVLPEMWVLVAKCRGDTCVT